MNRYIPTAEYGLHNLSGLNFDLIRKSLKKKSVTNDSYCKKFEKEVKSLKGWSKVNFHGYVSKNKIDEILLQSNIGIVTLHPTESYKESLPIKMFEYMSAGLPLIASDFEMWKPFILDNECGLMVNPLNVNEIAKKIDYLLLNKEEAQKMGKSGFQAVHNNYSWSTQEKKLINFYNKILKC